MAIMTVSRQSYSFGDEIAKQVADHLAYDFIDKQRIGQALAGMGLPMTEMEKYDEKKPSFWDSFLIQQNRFLYLIRAVIYEFAETNHTVILGRGAQVLLKDLPGTLRVRIVAPMEVRVARLMAHRGTDEKSAEKVLRHNDRDSSGFIRAFFGADWNDPDYYDLLINTRHISIDTASAMIENALRSAEFQNDAGDRSAKLADFSLQQKAEAAIMEIHRGNKLFITVAKVENGVVTLKGTTDSDTIRDECAQAVSHLRGVRQVNNEISVVKAYYG